MLRFAKIEKKNFAISQEAARNRAIDGKQRNIEKETFSISAFLLHFAKIEQESCAISPEAAR
ncbi:hypothetical protein ASG81_04785 [Paenibacillus sp. Soil522]|nr:hypothetical protein ASG81_04785 [Paenibacillus sp. Soil522]